MNINTALYDSIKSLGIVPVSKLDECIELANKSNTPLHDVILSKDLVSDENLGKLEADIYKLKYVSLGTLKLDQKLVQDIPLPYAKQYLCIIVNRVKDQTTVAIADPSNEALIKQLKIRFQNKVDFVLATKRDIAKAFSIYSNDLNTTISQLFANSIGSAQKGAGEPPIIEIVNTIIRFAYDKGASDIHIEPSSKGSLVRYRIDGIMSDILTIPIELHPRIATRLKVMANLRTDENLAPQDGKLVLPLDEEKLDVRVSFVPVTSGESIVMRLLSEKSRQFSLSDLGLSPSDGAKVELARKKPHGMILSTGPTGSGKTTSLYALLKLLNERSVTIMTIEDPVEYDIDGINQIQVNKATGLSFADGLRSIVRQDPDIILVGEIRDSETADIAVNSAMTGHLVLSTLHTNDASTAIPRLIEMEVEPFLIASTINVIIAQRLVRKICTSCRRSIEVEASALAGSLSSDLVSKYFGSTTTRLYQGVGCNTCNNKGYIGRIGIFEVMTISDNLKSAITKNLSAKEIQNIAVQEGMTTMLEDGLSKVKAGITTIEEILRVTKE